MLAHAVPLLAAVIVAALAPATPAAAETVVVACRLAADDWTPGTSLGQVNMTVVEPVVSVSIECVFTGGITGTVTAASDGNATVGTGVLSGSRTVSTGTYTSCIEASFVRRDGTTGQLSGLCSTQSVGGPVVASCEVNASLPHGAPGAVLHGEARSATTPVSPRLAGNLRLRCTARTALGHVATAEQAMFGPAVAVAAPVPLAPTDRVVEVCARVELTWAVLGWYEQESCYNL